MSEESSRLQRLFRRALDLPIADRDAFVESECAGDVALREALRGLLAHDGADDGFLEGGSHSTSAACSSPRSLGRYRIVRELGRGGMGVVYEAEQEDPTRRVALKVLRTGFVSDSLVSRFKREAQALAQLQHRGIAHVYESGSARIGNDDVPFFAMEYIDGRTLDKHAETSRLSVRQKLELIARVCDAVQHAHQKGVIHRDLKPSNVLVVEESAGTGAHDETGTVADAIGQPKILDFGIARFTDSDVHATLQTSTGQIVGTLAYMSPEQADGRPEDLDTRCDVYALGVMLYALLAGRTPHDLGGLPVAEAARMIKDEEPESLCAIDVSLRGDVATIASKAMDKDRDRRYASAGLMAEDIRRFLRDEPIAARPVSTLYQLRKFARRNKTLVGGVAASFVLLVLGVVGTSLGLAWALRANADLGIANTELARANIDLGQSNEALEQANIDLGQANQDLKQTNLDLVAANEDIASMNRVQRVLLSKLDAQRMGEIIREQLWNELSEEQADDFARYQDRVNFASVARGTLRGAIYLPAVGVVNRHVKERPLVRARLLVYIAQQLYRLGYGEQAAPLAVESLDVFRANLGPEHGETIMCEAMASAFLLDAGDVESAAELARSNLAATRRIQPPDPDRLEAALRSMGRFHARFGELAEARACYEEALRLWRDFGAGGDANGVWTMAALAGVRGDEGDLVGAEEQYRAALAFARDAVGESVTTAVIQRDFGRFLSEHGRAEEGTVLLRAALDSMQRLRGATYPGTLRVRHALAQALIAVQRYAEAEGHALEIERVVRGAHGAGSERASEATRILVSLYEVWHDADPGGGHDAKAERWRESVVPPAEG